MTHPGRPLKDQSDAALLRGSGTVPAAFSELYLRHVEAVHAWLGRRLEWAASDLTAETFARAWLIRDRFQDERDGSVLRLGVTLPADAQRRGPGAPVGRRRPGHDCPRRDPGTPRR